MKTIKPGIEEHRECGLNLYAVMTGGTEFEYIRLGTGCTDAIRRAELRGWYKAHRCEVCTAIYA